MKNKNRIDIWLVENAYCNSRQKAQALIMSGLVYRDEVKILKASEIVAENDNIIVREKEHNYVSRGALKLEKALNIFHANVADKVCMDIGAATGGFTDVLLKNNAKHVYAIDVGYGQFAWELRTDSRVTLMERVNARFLTADMFVELPQIAVMDVSFISIKLIIPKAFEIMGDQGLFYVLIKPQFEAGRENIGKNGVVKDASIHEKVIFDIIQFLNKQNLCISQLDYSPIKGPKGNIEYICEIGKNTNLKAIDINLVKQVVHAAHQELD